MMGISTEDMNNVVEDDSHSSPGGTDCPICGSGRDILPLPEDWSKC